MSEENIFLHAQISGGSFGRRLEDDYVRQAVELAKAHQGVPIKMTCTREEDMTHDFPRPLAIARMHSVAAQGHVRAYDFSIAARVITVTIRLALEFERKIFCMPSCHSVAPVQRVVTR